MMITCNNSPDGFLVEDAEKRYSHAGAGLHHHLDELPPFSEVIAQYKTGGFPHEAGSRTQHQPVTVAFCKSKSYDFTHTHKHTPVKSAREDKLRGMIFIVKERD